MNKEIHKLVIENIVSGYGGMNILKGVSLEISQEEIIFSLDGLGLLGFESAIQRDYPVMFGTLFIFTLLGLIVGIISDLMYTVIDPRIDFDTREV